MLSHINVKKQMRVEILIVDHLYVVITRGKQQPGFGCVVGPNERSKIKDLEFHPPTCCDEWELGG